MPYKVRQKDNGKWEVYNPDTGKVYGTHDSEKDAEDQKKALYANADPENETIHVRKKSL
jgi:acyl-CoA reductase-like NAD-dependent aldehyde dehydrogenase